MAFTGGQKLTASLLNTLVGQAGHGTASSNLALTSTTQDVPGATATLTALTSSAVYIVVGQCRIDRSGTSSAIAIPRLVLDGTQLTQFPVQVGTAVTGGIQTVTACWSGTVAAGSHTWKITASCATALVWTVQSGDSNISVLLIG